MTGPVVVTLRTNLFARQTLEQWAPYVAHVAACRSANVAPFEVSDWVAAGQPAGPGHVAGWPHGPVRFGKNL